MKLGRTGRKRKRRREKSSNISLNGRKEIIDLMKWIKINNLTFHKNLKLFEFPNTGRGVMAMEHINSGDILIDIPLNMIINPITLQNDDRFMSILLSQPTRYTCQELLAFYIAYLLIINKNTTFSNYIETLPTILNLPYFCEYSLKNFDEKIHDIVFSQKEKILKSYQNFKTTLGSNITFKSHQNTFTLKLYELSYFIVNTRCIYINPQIVKEKLHVNCKSDIMKYLLDEPNLCLIPFMDMFNHSDSVKTKTEFSNINFFTKRNTSDYTFKLIVLNTFKKYDQIFICYGEHSNLKLITEYGFYLENNSYTIVPFNFNYIVNLFHNKIILYTISDDKYKFLKKNCIDQNIYIDNNGYSYNFKRLLYIIISNDIKLWNLKCYSDNYDTDEIVKMTNLGNVILNNRKNDLSIRINKVKDTECIQLELSINLIKEYIGIISKNLNM